MNNMTEQQVETLIRSLRAGDAELKALIELTAAQKVTAAQLQHVSDKIDEIRKAQQEQNKDIEGRLRKVEKWRDEIGGAWKLVAMLAAAVGGAIGAAIEYVLSHWGAKTP